MTSKEELDKKPPQTDLKLVFLPPLRNIDLHERIALQI
jgi:hypothetical protein